jgi:hypothetical protein
MATESVAALRVVPTQPDYIYSDQDPFERAWARLTGINALHVVASCAIDSENGAPSPKVWEDLWFFIGIITENVNRDLCELRGKIHKAAT